MRVGYKLCVAGVGLLFASAAFATQTVTPVKDAGGTNFTANGANSWAATVPAGTQLVFFGRYSSDNPNESGLGLKVSYDNTKFTSVTVDNLLTKCMVATPQVDQVGGAVYFGWADTSIRRTSGVPNGVVGWTGTADPAAPGATDGCLNPGGIVTTSAAFGPPTNLFRILATTAPGFTSGTSTITLSSTSFSKAGGQNSGAFTNQTLVATGAAGPTCNLDLDGDGSVLAGKDGIMLARALNPNITDTNVVLGIVFSQTATRTTGAAIRAYLNTWMSGVGSLTNLGPTPIDVDSNGATTAGVDGTAVKRAINPNITSTNVTLGLPVAAGTTGSAIRSLLNANCGLSLTP